MIGLRRWRVYYHRIQKERPKVWMARLAAAHARKWDRLNALMINGQLNETALARLERHNRRLCKLKAPFARRDHRLMEMAFHMPITLFPVALMPPSHRTHHD